MNCNLLEKLGLFRGVCADQVLKKKRLKPNKLEGQTTLTVQIRC